MEDKLGKEENADIEDLENSKMIAKKNRRRGRQLDQKKEFKNKMKKAEMRTLAVNLYCGCVIHFLR